MSSSRFPGKISLSIKRQKRQLLDIRSELRNGSRDNVQQHQHQQERETADHVLPQDRISSGLSLFYSLVHPDRDPDVDSDPEDQVTELDFEGFTQDQVDHVRAQQLISYPLSDNGVNGKSVPEPVSGDAEQQAMTAADSSSIRRGSKSVSRKSSANETKSLVSKKESRRKKEPLTNHATKVTATSSSSFSLSSSSLLPLNGANRDPKFVTQSQHDAEDKDVTTSDEAADLIPSLHRDDDITGQEHPDNHRRIISKQPRRQQRPRKEQAKTTDDSEADTENDSDPPVRKRVPGNPSDTIVRKDRGERDDTTSGSGRGNKRKNARRTPSSHQPSLSSSLQVRPATTSSLATISHRDQSPVTSDDSTGDPSHRSQKHSGKNKKAIISQALASLQNKWKERVLSSRQGLGMQRSGSGLAGSCLLLESPATPESPASFSGGSHSRVPGGILREARLQVDESTLNQIRTQTSDDSDDQSTDNEGDSEATTTECGPRGDGSNEDDENLAVREHTSGSSSGRKKSPRKQKRLSVEKAPKHTPSKYMPLPCLAIQSMIVTLRLAEKKNPGTIECVICSAIKYYSHKQRRHGVFACETCAKFFSSFMRNRKAYFCNNTGSSIYAPLFLTQRD